MDAAASLTNDTTGRAGILLDQVAVDADGQRAPAQTRLEELIGAELARRLVDALATRLRG